MGNTTIKQQNTFTITCMFGAKGGIAGGRDVIIRENGNQFISFLPSQIWTELVLQIQSIPNEIDPNREIRKKSCLQTALITNMIGLMIGFMGGFFMSIIGCITGDTGVCVVGIILAGVFVVSFIGFFVLNIMMQRNQLYYRTLCTNQLMKKSLYFQQRYTGIVFSTNTTLRNYPQLVGQVIGPIFINQIIQTIVYPQQQQPQLMIVPNNGVPMMPPGVQYNNLSPSNSSMYNNNVVNNNMNQQFYPSGPYNPNANMQPMYNNNNNNNNNNNYNNNNMQQPNYSAPPLEMAPQQPWQQPQQEGNVDPNIIPYEGNVVTEQ